MSKVLFVYLIFIFAATSSNSYGNVTISGTRVILNEDDPGISVKLNNKGIVPVLVQSWIDGGEIDSNPEDTEIPFTITPPLARIEGKKGLALRITATDKSMLNEKNESLFWLNVLEIPASRKKNENNNRLQMAFRTRIKLLYRPKSLVGKYSDNPENLSWELIGNNLVVKNKSEFNITLTSIYVNENELEFKNDYLKPRERLEFTIKRYDLNRTNILKYSYINDWGAIKNIEKTL